MPQRRDCVFKRLTGAVDIPFFSVAIVDSGLDETLAAFSGVNVSGEGDIGDTRDRCGHGDAVASTIRRFAPQVALAPVKATDRRGVLRDRDALAAAFDWILAHREARAIGLVVMALGDQGNHASDEAFRGSPLQERIAALRGLGVLTVAPAGNWRGLHGCKPEGMVWPGILREIVSVGEARRGRAGLRLSPASQRLRATSASACATTLFTEAAPPGETSGAAAAVAGMLTHLMAQGRPGEAEAALSTLLSFRREALDEAGAAWPAALAEDFVAG